MFQDTYKGMQEKIFPSPTLTAKVLSKTNRRIHRLPRRVIAAAAAAAVLLATPALAAQTEIGYGLLYAVAPAAAQFFQPVQRSCTENGITMEVVSVQVEGDTAQAYVAFSGETVDGTCDLFDSWNFHLPFDQIGHCEQVDYDAATHTALFLCTTQTMDGSSIPQGGKMTFSVGCFLSGKETAEDIAVDLSLANYAVEAATASSWSDPSEKTSGAFYRTGGSYDDGHEVLFTTAPILRPGEKLAEPVSNMPISAAGYADGLFHIQLCRGDATAMDNHGWLWLEDADGNQVDPLCTIDFHDDPQTETDGRMDYTDFLFDVSPAELSQYTLHGDFYISTQYTEGNWRITFPLVNEH